MIARCFYIGLTQLKKLGSTLSSSTSLYDHLFDTKYSSQLLNPPIFLLYHPHLRRNSTLFIRRKFPSIMQPSTNIFNLHGCPTSYLSYFPTSSPCGQNPNPFYSFQIGLNTPQFMSLSSNNSTSDEAEENLRDIIDDRKQRKKISNRESARRSRMRKQRQLDELWSQVMWLRNENHQLLHKLNRALESHEKVVEENAQLKEEAFELKKMISGMQLQNQSSCFRDDIV